LKNIAPDSPSSFTLKDDPERLAVEIKLAEKCGTTSLNVMDAQGNIFSHTLSDGNMTTPKIPGWGFAVGARGGQFNLVPNLANVVAPFKRPRNTNAPHLVMKDGKPFIGISTPSADRQVQSQLQVLLNIFEWGMNPQQAIDQPRALSFNYASSGREVNVGPAQLRLEERIPQKTFEALKKLGHDVRGWELWQPSACCITLTYLDPVTGYLITASDVRRETFALGY